MKLMVIGSGLINSEIIKEKGKDESGNEIDVCKFQFLNYNSTDKNGNIKYSRYLCFAKNYIAKIIISNFVKGQKIFIIGTQEQNEVVGKEQNNIKKLITMIEITHIEFMGNSKNIIKEKQNENAESIDDIVTNILINRKQNNQNEVFT